MPDRYKNFRLRSLLKYLATLGFIGYLPVAPGTFGSLVAAIFFVLLKPGDVATVSLLIIVILIGTIAAHHMEKVLNEKDSRHIVIDEFAGYIVSVLLLPSRWPYYVAAFLLFRFFDILKPPPLRRMERFPGGLGIMADDILAGVYTNILLQVWKVLTEN